MKIADVTISDVTATAKILSKIPAGLIGGTVGLRFPDPYWGRMVKNAKFRAQGLPDIPPILGVGDTVTIPAVLVQAPNYRLEIGIVGVADDGTTEITPTLWADLGVVRPSAAYIPEPEGDEPEGGGDAPEATPETWMQLLAMIGNLENLPTSAKTSVVAAIREIYGSLNELTEQDLKKLNDSLDTVRTNVGELGNLSTAEKSSIVAAINEVAAKMGENSGIEEILQGLADTLEPVVADVGALKENDAAQDNDLAEIFRRLADLEYVPIDITGISNTAGTILAGTVLKSLGISWTVAGTPAAQSISSGQTLTADQRSVTLAEADLVDVRAENKLTHGFTVTATDARGKTDKGTTNVVFQNKVWYGSAPIPAAIDSAFVQSLPKSTMTGTRARSFAMDDKDGYYTWYVCPVRLGACKFKTNGFDGGLSLATTDPVLIENELGYAEKCYIYRSDYDGQTGVNVEVI